MAILSITAVGTGVTLTAADTVVFFELCGQWSTHAQVDYDGYMRYMILISHL